MIAVVAVVLVIVMVAAGVFASGILNKKDNNGTNSNLGGNGTGDARIPKTVNSTAFAPAGSGTVGSSGGRIIGSSAAAGLVIDVPSGATSESISFVLSAASPTTTNGLPAGTEFVSPLFKIVTSGSTQWN
ncbi:MAG: hypothetical protein WCK39_11670, partial [Methanomassiliicoccales archaeon]